MAHYLLNIRLTKSCNADCTYCSSWQESPDSYMTRDLLINNLGYIFDSLHPAMNLKIDKVTIQYLGGEVLTIPVQELNEIVESVRSFFSDRRIALVDGVQSNIIVSKRRLLNAMRLFSGRVGTSVDSSTGKRTLAGSSEAYSNRFDSNVALLQPSSGSGVVFTVEDGDKTACLDEYARAKESGLPFTFRLVYKGGKEAVKFVSPDDYSFLLNRIFDDWFLKSSIPVEPLHDMVISRLQNRSTAACSSCNRQSTCAKEGLNIEPNGDLYLCMETSDSGLYKLGNAQDKVFDFVTWSRLSQRDSAIKLECSSCRFYNSCKGGCLVESVQQGNGLYSRTPYCSTYKSIFAKIDSAIESAGPSEVKAWLSQFHTNLHLGVA